MVTQVKGDISPGQPQCSSAKPMVQCKGLSQGQERWPWKQARNGGEQCDPVSLIFVMN